MLQSANSDSGASRKDIYELYKQNLTPTAIITGKKFNNSNIINARTAEGQTYFYPASLIAGEQPIIAAVVMRGSEAKWVASTTDETIQAQVGSKATVKQQGEKEGEQSVAFGQVGIVIKDPNGNSTVIVASTKDMTEEGRTKAINYIIADEPQPELYAEIVGVNKFPAVIESEEDTIQVDTQDAGNTNSEKFIATNKLTDGTEVFTFYSKSANSLVRLNAEELKKALLGQKFKFSFTGVQPNERGWLDFVTVKKEQSAYAAVADNLGQEFRDITIQKKFQVSLGSMMNNQQYVSPLTGTQYNSYFEYLTSTTEFSDPRTDGLGANAILTTDKYAHGPSSPFYDVGVSLSQLTTLEGDVKTEEEMELKQVVASTTPKPAPQPTAAISAEVKALQELRDARLSKMGFNWSTGYDAIVPGAEILQADTLEELTDKINAEYEKGVAALEGKPAVATPAVVQAPAAPKVTSSSQVIEDDLSLLMNPSKPIEEKPVSSDIIVIPFDPGAAAVIASEKESVTRDQTAELNKTLGEPMSDFGDLINAAKTQGEQTKNDC